MSIYQFCVGCTEKTYKYDDVGKLIDHSCPARYNPFDEDVIFNEETKELTKTSKCSRHDKFMKMEKQKQEIANAKRYGD